MERLEFDDGVREFRLGSGGVLRFNPTDPNVYARFLEACERISAMEAELREHTEAPDSAKTAKLLSQLDGQVRQELGWVFGGNDVGAALGGVNLLAVAGNGERVITNFLAAIGPVLARGASSWKIRSAPTRQP